LTLDDLLSSQPLCFNLFGELKLDLELASRVIAYISGGRFPEVTGIDFEYSPGRRYPRYLNDRSAFDVFLRCVNESDEPCFVAVEVKYHENLYRNAGEHRKRYDEVADLMGCFRDDRALLQRSPLQQIWRDHLLAGITLVQDGYRDGLFVMLYPADNNHVFNAVSAYEAQLTNRDSFAAWTLEQFVDALHRHSDATWIDAFENRYLKFEKIDRLIDSTD